MKLKPRCPIFDNPQHLCSAAQVSKFLAKEKLTADTLVAVSDVIGEAQKQLGSQSDFEGLDLTFLEDIQ